MNYKLPRLLPFALNLLLITAVSFVAQADESAAINQPESANSKALSRGKTIFTASCAECHGSLGEGVQDAFESPLVGDASIAELTELIADTMPEEDPDACVGEEAAAVATYIHETFYSPAAQLRLNPPRKRLARLTAHQLRQSLADLYSHFGTTSTHTDELGIRARYFNRDNDDGQASFDRKDSIIDFDFGTEGPGQGVNAKNYSIQWNTALKADVTGHYELIIRSTGAFIFYFGGHEREFINNYVQSENRTEFRKSIFLTGGRVYPLKIDFHQRKRKTEQPDAKISLSWRTPHGLEQIIPATQFANVYPASTFALQAKLPPDDRSYGYERGIAIDRQWDESTTKAAIEFSDLVVSELWPDYRKKHKHESNANRGRLRKFLQQMVETAFRGTVSDDIQKLYVNDQIDAAEDDADAIRRVLLIALKSPRFLYPMLDGDQSKSRRAANRLALTLFDSLPSDRWLLDDAKYNQLDNEHQVRDAARRMVDDWRTQGKTRQFLYSWLNLSHIDEISKNEEIYPGFDEALVADLRDSLDRFLDDIVWSKKSDFRQLLNSNRSFTTPRIGEFFGEKWKAPAGGDGLRPTTRDSEIRFGVLSHPYLMSGLAYRDSTSPIHRGVFLLRYIFGRTLRPPNEAFTPLSPDLHPDLTTRERVALQTSPENCQVCHAKINGLGFILENFDAVGRYQTEEQGRAIDTTGRYTTGDGEEREFKDIGDLSTYLVKSRDAQRAFVVRAFHHFVKQPIAAYGWDAEAKLMESFEKNDFSIRELIVEISVIAATTEMEKKDSGTN